MIDPMYFLFALPGFIIALWAQGYVKSSFAKFSKVFARSGATGRDAANMVLRMGEVSDVTVEPVGGSLTDHFDPRSKVIRLSEPVYASNSLAAVGVAAHEAGHALQHDAGYIPAGIRSAIVPVASLGSGAAMPLFFIGLIFHFGALQMLGILLFAGVAVFQLVTLPVEINASRRALRALQSSGVLAEDELPAARKVLYAAALTYVAALLQSLLLLLYMLSGRRR